MAWPGLVEGVPLYGRWVETRWSISSLPNQTIHGSMTELQHWYLQFHLCLWTLLNSALGIGIKMEGVASGGSHLHVPATSSWFQLALKDLLQDTVQPVCCECGTSGKVHLRKSWNCYREKGSKRLRNKRDGDPLKTGFSTATCGLSTLEQGKAWEEGVAERDHKVLTALAFCPISSSLREDRGVKEPGKGEEERCCINVFPSVFHCLN